MAQKYDKKKYEVSKDMPDKFAQVIPGMGVQHFSKEHLSDHDLKALVLAKNQFVTALGEAGDEKPAYTDIGAGQFPS
jgi:hypothetical protein